MKLDIKYPDIDNDIIKEHGISKDELNKSSNTVFVSVCFLLRGKN